MVERFVLSLFPGIDLLGRAFEEAGYCVVRGPDLIFGGDVRTFRPPIGVFEGVIGGPPCQDFSGANRCDKPRSEGRELMEHYGRIVRDSAGVWFLCENVPRVTELEIEGFTIQRFMVDCREVGNQQIRPRLIQFGSRDGSTIRIKRDNPDKSVFAPCVMATEGRRVTRRRFEDCCQLQGLPRSFDLPGFSMEGKYRAIGNGVPMELGRELAAAVTCRLIDHDLYLCVCGCGREVGARGLQAGPSCRKRMQRRRDRSSCAKSA